MIKIQRMLDTARAASISQLPLAQNNEDNTNRLLSIIDLAMVELYKRFNLGIHIEQKDITGGSLYRLEAVNADISQVLAVIDSNGEEYHSALTLDDETAVYRQLSFNTFIFNFASPTKVTFLCKVAPQYPSTLYKFSDTSTHDAAVDIPAEFLTAITDFIGYRAHATVTRSADTPGLNESDTYRTRFEATCKDLEARGYKVPLFSVRESIAQKTNGAF